MDSESIYANDEITEVAEKVAEYIFNASGILKDVLLMRKQWKDGPLAMFIFWSHKYNPLGKFGIEVETLTVAQKRIVGDAMAISGSDR